MKTPAVLPGFFVFRQPIFQSLEPLFRESQKESGCFAEASIPERIR
jgi:hypothetical protein